MNTQKKTLEEILERRNMNEMLRVGSPDVEAIAEIQALVKEAIPEKNNGENCHRGCERNHANDLNCYHDTQDDLITEIATALIERGLLKGEEE